MLSLNEEQMAAAHYSGPAKNLLVLAGAGTGKTRTLIGRVIYLIKQGVPAKRILLLTFTRRAAGEMRVRLKQEIGGDANKIMAGTFHQFCLKIMQVNPDAFGYKSLSVIDMDDAKSVVSSVRGAYIKKTGLKALPKAEEIQQVISYSTNICMDLKKYLKEYSEYDDVTIQSLSEIAKLYEKAKLQRYYLDYDDILSKFAGTLQNNRKLASKLATVFPHILVDEFQDNNGLQYSILKCLSEASLFLVGDDAQSIYSFRGADFNTVHDFKKATPNSEVLKLVENYRSYQEILAISNWLLSESPVGYDKYLVSARGNGPKPHLLDFEYRHEEANWVASDIQNKQMADQPLSNIMVLVRTAFSAKDLEAELIERDIPYQFVGGTSLLESAHVKDVLALCRIVINRYDEIAWFRFLKMYEGIGDVTARKVTEEIFKNDPSIPETVLIERVIKERVDIVESFNNAKVHRNNPKLALESACKSLDALMKAKYDNFDRREQDLILLCNMAERFKSLESFLETYTLNPVTKTENDDQEAPEEKVTLITVHSAKGLESPICYCIGVQPGLYPHVRSLGDEEKMEEERRVLYVALTRAKDELYITRSNEQPNAFGIPDHGGSDYYLLNDLPDSLVSSDFKGHQAPDEDAWLSRLDYL